MAVQEWIDRGGLKGRAITSDGIRETHRRFCELLPRIFSGSRTRKRKSASA